MSYTPSRESSTSITPSRESSSSIKVVARFRPQNATELQQGGSPIVSFVGEDTCTLETKDFGGNFTFDQVFSMDSKQSDVFNFSIKSTVDDILNGYNGTVFAYGQTGAGKSYTMMGPSIEGAQRGIIPRIVEQIFASIMQSPAEIEYTVRVSYMEIYMERIKDLLQPTNDNLPIHEEKSKGVYVKGLSEIYVASVDEVYEVMRQGAAARAVASTNMNQESSRSHSIFALVVSQKNVETGSSKTGQLFLVDLAGSEKVGKTGASGLILEEAKKINKSLSALGMVINALTDGKSTHVPYRDSKLTRILQESLGGNSRTTLIVNCSPSSYNDQETISTLRFGVRAKNIKNKPKINAELSPAELKLQLKKIQSQNSAYAQYIATLEKEVAQWRGGEQIPKDKWAVLGPSAAQRTLSETPSTPRPLSTSDLLLRSATPKPAFDADEREEFLKRENDLQDRLADRETVISGLERLIAELKEDSKTLGVRETDVAGHDEKLHAENAELKNGIEKLQLEARDTATTLDGLKELNAETTAELDAVRKLLHDATMLAQEKSVKLEERTRRKNDKIRQMTSGFEYFAISNGLEAYDEDEITALDTEPISKNGTERYNQKDWIGTAISTLDKSQGEAIGGLGASQITALKAYLMEAREFISRTGQMLDNRLEEAEVRMARSDEIEALLQDLKMTVASLADSREGEGAKLDDYIKTQQSLLDALLSDAKRDLSLAVADNKRLRKIIITETASTTSSTASSLISSTSSVSSTFTRPVEALSGSPVTATFTSLGTPVVSMTSSSAPTSPTKDRHGKTMKQQLVNFEGIKKSLMRDLQNRCERVVELEISLDEMREQYKSVLKTANASKSQQKRMAFLERNLEQLTQVQRALVDQNAQFKRELAISERKLRVRDERIEGLEMLLQDAQERLAMEAQGFETRLGSLRERLEDVKAFRKQADGKRSPGSNSIMSLQGSQRIVKPLRGGGGGMIPVVSGGSSPLGAYFQSTDSENRSDSHTSPTGSQRRNWFGRT
ncbi:P-loop containing nucleoside triphosphate hydrolase protein [Lipomyces doorenjongii]|uniref:P-loop containing nucleoside triphosphate hydrolase protein n=1 Tax=Lipomyces doorenjongii TaxID=383834 RepID=UPI0034CF7C42